MISTRLLHAMFAVRGAAPEHGAKNLVEAATRSIPVSGGYIDDGRPAEPSAQVRDPAFRRRLHTVTSVFSPTGCNHQACTHDALPASSLRTQNPGEEQPS
ncbi:hypothetical protein SAZ11_47545 [Streptomyces sp. FXJ1.4098]|nr:hypothetical protein [Streptomyces sp. FXJ1.4098]